MPTTVSGVALSSSADASKNDIRFYELSRAPLVEATTAASIIPDPGPRPTVAPRDTEIIASGEFPSLTIGANEIVYVTDLTSAVRTGLGATITNNGTVWIETSRLQTFFAVADQPDIYNNGLIYLRGESQVVLNNGADRLVNTGDIFAVSNSGWARVVQAGRFALVDNSGIIAAQTLQSTPFANSGNAVAIDSFNGAIINNRLGGQILAEAPDLAIAISLGGPDLDTGDPSVTNRGLIAASATGDDGVAFAIYSASSATTLINSGTIRAEVAVYNIGHIINEAGGVIEGLVIQEEQDDTIVNDGRIVGRAFMGEGNDTFSGSGRVEGFVDMGWGDDSFEGSGVADIATGNRGNDVLSGLGGNDLLLGGHGDDRLTGGNGNDGLYGEFGHDIIVTLGGDHVEAGAGDDRIELGDYRFAAVFGGSGFDVLAMASGARNFSLSALLVGERLAGIDAIELRGNQQLAIDTGSIAKLADDGRTLWVDATGTDTVHLAGNWTRGADTSFGGVSYQTWSQGGFTVLVTAATSVSNNSAPSYGGLDAIAGGSAAPRPGAATGIELAPLEVFVTDVVLDDPDVEGDGSYDFVVAADEVYFTVGESPLFRAGETLATFTNNGVLLAFNDDGHISNGVYLTRQTGFVDFTNNGLVLTRSDGPVSDEFGLDFISIAVFVEGDIVNHGEIEVFAANGNVLAARVNTRAGLLSNDGDIIAISGSNAAFGVEADAIDVFGQRSFFNTGLIYAEGVNVSDPGIYDPVTTHPVAGAVAVAARLFGNVINDGRIIAATGEGAVEGARAIGLAMAPRSAGGLTLTNNGEISGTLSVFFYGNTTGGNQGHTLNNNGLLVGDVHFAGGVPFSNGGNDTIDNRNGEIRGTVYGFVGSDVFFTGAFDDNFDGGAGLDTAVFDGNLADFRVTETSVGRFTITGSGTDTVVGVERLRFDDVEAMLDLGNGLVVAPGSADPDSFMLNIRDYDGNDLGGASNWQLIGQADANLDGRADYIFVNNEIGRFAEVSVAANGRVYFDNHGLDGDTRVVGIYIDPLVQSGEVEAGSDFDSQRRFQNDLFIGNIARVLGSDDYDDDGFAEIFFSLTDGTAYLRAIMHADGNIQYANYQSEQQVIDYLTANGYDESTFGDWFTSSTSGTSDTTFVNRTEKAFTAEVESLYRPEALHARPIDEFQPEFFG